MDTALTQKFPFILDRNLAKANCTGNRVSKSCDNVVLAISKKKKKKKKKKKNSILGNYIKKTRTILVLIFSLK